MSMKVALYARVSTRDKDQNPENQLIPLREQTDKDDVAEYVDYASANDSRGRVHWRRLLKDAYGRKFERVMVLRLDRAFRSVRELLNTVSEWDSVGIKFISLREGFDTDTAMGRLVMTMLASIAEFELSFMRERILDGMARARGEGKHLGRPKGSRDKEKRRTSGYRMREAEKARSKEGRK